ncbi:MAG TPA: double-strand break repair protein AddB [Acetobacteraceae bacterium]|nr:double-strand break repair protein AddB [Acetobacteraceae bacterium]
MALNLFAIPPHVPFLDALARGWLAADPDPVAVARGLILLPTRRAARALAEAFLRVYGGRGLLLPRITALGGPQEAPLALAGSLDLPPAVEPMQRLAALTRLILGMRGAAGAPHTADRAWQLAGDLADLMDEAERAEINLAQRLPDAAHPDFAAHWAETLRFLHIVTEAWPAWLAESGLMNPAARQVALLDAQATAWQAAPPDHRVLIAGTTAGIPAIARLLAVVARLPQGQVVLPALDAEMDDIAWAALEDSHAQAGLARLLNGLGATRGDVRVWGSGGRESGAGAGVPAERFAALSRVLLPAAALDDWRSPSPGILDGPLAGIWRLKPADQQQEAEAIAMILRDALEMPGARTALVTPDRDLAGRVAAALPRYGVIADDSAGEKLAETPPAVFLRLLTRVVAEELAPVPLLALLKHPLAAAGLSPAACRTAARELELACLRGPRPTSGVSGLRRTLDKAQANARTKAFLARLETCLEPALRIEASVEVSPAEALDALIEAAERLAATADAEGASLLWAGEEGEALASHLAALRASLPMLPDQRRAVLPGLLDAVLEGVVVRSRRALRGRTGTEHPRVFIWGLLEARLQSVDRIVLAGLAEGAWPPLAEPGPWLSRPMRTAVGLPSPEQAVGQAAHDLLAAACSAKEVILSCPVRRDGAPAVPARWLVRLDMFLAGNGLALPEHPAVSWGRALDQPLDAPKPVRPPRPDPPLHRRPRKLSVTEIETWLRDPYAIYARHILRLKSLDPIDQATDAADYGSLVHAGLHRFLQAHGAAWPPDAAAELKQAMHLAMNDAGLRPALVAWWAPRLDRIVDWVAEAEIGRRVVTAPVAILTEAGGAIEFDRPGGRFRLTGRADRIERRPDGALSILDYKTGTPPRQAEVEAGLAPQLLLEAMMAAEGGFGPDATGPAAELLYWRLSGGSEPGEARSLFKGNSDEIVAAVDMARERLCALIDDFDQAERCYISHPHPDRAPRFSDYATLARVAEWSAAGEEG